jgi:hypothetical protein
MEIDTKDILKKKILDAQEMVRDYQRFSSKIDNPELAEVFRISAEECGMQARRLQKFLDMQQG